MSTSAARSTKLLGFGLAIITACLSCHSGTNGKVKCTADAPLEAIAFSPDKLNLLVGEFELTQVNTANVSLVNNTVRTQLKTSVADSARRIGSLEHRIGHIPRKLLLIGTRMIPPNSSIDTVEFDDSRFTAGCVDCTETSPDYFYVTTANANGFWGNWVNNKTGATTFFVDDDPDAPHPTGYFCAIRKAN
ncbi:MAG: hypothetical protein ABJC26_09060 [Gemmatimonadaceae bacterium]